MDNPSKASLNFYLTGKQWLVLGALLLCFGSWFTTRFDFLFLYQIPPNQTIHPNYYTFHDMSENWLKGEKLGVVDISRMMVNMHRLQISDYILNDSPKDGKCTYLALDPGFGIIVAIARKLMTDIPDSYLRAECLQLVCDGVMLFLLFFTFLRMGIIPATMAGLFYGVHPVFAYQAVFPFQYFWEGWLISLAVISLIWARRALVEGDKRLYAIPLIILAAAAIGFTLWVRSTALIVALTFIAVFLTVPSLRRYCGIFFLIFALTIMPQVMRASSVMGHFALSTRMSWHTAFQGLGHYPNQYGLEDEDLYVFTKTEKDYGIRYNYCDYTKHDIAAQKEFMQVWRQDPGFVTRSLAARITSNILFNYDFDFRHLSSILCTLMGLTALLFALRRRGEHLFIAGMMAMVYIGYAVAIGLVYYMAPPYGYVALLALLFTIPSFTAFIMNEGAMLLDHPRKFFSSAHWRWPEQAPIAKTAMAGITVIVLSFAAALCVPAVHNYLFPHKPYQELWISYNQPNLDDNQMLVHQWEALPQEKKFNFLKLVYREVPHTANAGYDVSHFIADKIHTLIYLERLQNHHEKPVFTYVRYKADVLGALNAVSLSILGWRADKIDVFNINDPDSWDGRKIHMTLITTPERAGVDYQRLANEKFARFNYAVTWLGPNELIARHNGQGCDALRTVVSMLFNAYCPYDPTTGASPLDPGNVAPDNTKSLTPADKKAF